MLFRCAIFRANINGAAISSMDAAADAFHATLTPAPPLPSQRSVAFPQFRVFTFLRLSLRRRRFSYAISSLRR